MVQHDVSLNCVMAWIGWALAIVIGAANIALPDVKLAPVWFLCGAAGATLHVRGFIARLEQREREAFQLGRESVSQLRR